MLAQSPCRSSRPEVFCEKGVFRNFAKFTGKHLCQSLFFNKVAGVRPAKYTRFSSSLAYTTVASSVTFNVKHLFCKGHDSLFLQLQPYYFAFQRKMVLSCDAVTELTFLMQL